MTTPKKKHKMTELAIKQNLLLWQMTKSLLNIEQKLKDEFKTNT